MCGSALITELQIPSFIRCIEYEPNNIECINAARGRESCKGLCASATGASCLFHQPCPCVLCRVSSVSALHADFGTMQVECEPLVHGIPFLKQQSLLPASIRLPRAGRWVAVLSWVCSCLVLTHFSLFFPLSFLSPFPPRRELGMCAKRYGLCVLKMVFTLQVLPLSCLFDKYDPIKAAARFHEVSYQLNKRVQRAENWAVNPSPSDNGSIQISVFSPLPALMHSQKVCLSLLLSSDPLNCST